MRVHVTIVWLLAGLGFGLAGCSDEPADTSQDPAPTWNDDVADVMQKHCTSCHKPGGIGPFDLRTYGTAHQQAELIAKVVQDRSMPPWLVGNGRCRTFREPRWLKDAEVEAVARWAESGALPGDAAKTMDATAPPIDATLTVDAVLDPGAKYTPDDKLKDDYRCFIVDPKLPDDRFITAYRVVPGDPRVVHHAILYSLDSDVAEQSAAKLDAKDTRAGYPCFGSSGVGDSRPLAGWAPGTPPTRFPKGTGIRLVGKRKLVVQVHYNLANGPHPDRTTVELELAASVPREALIIPLAHTSMKVPIGEALAKTSFDLNLGNVSPLGVWVHGVFPHMHKLGKTMRVEKLAAGSKKASCLVDVERWDFGWQQFHFYEKPVYVQSTDTVRLTCGYDTRGRTKPVTWGEGTNDEMCLAGFFVTLH